MIEFKLGKSYFRYNNQHEISYRLFITSRKESGGKTIVKYIVNHYNKGHLTDIDDCDVEVDETPVCHDSDTEVLYIKGFKVFIPADARNTDYYITSYKEYIHSLITNRHFLKLEMDKLSDYVREYNIKAVLLTLVLGRMNTLIESVILDEDNMDGIVLLITIANSLMADIEISDGIHFHKSKVFLSSPVTVVYNSQLSKFILVDILYDFYKDIMNTDTGEIIENLITTYLTLE